MGVFKNKDFFHFSLMFFLKEPTSDEYFYCAGTSISG